MARPRVKDKILDAAFLLLQQHPAHTLTTKSVAESAGVTEASIFNNFGNKANLIEQIIQQKLPAFLDFKNHLQKKEVKVLQPWLVETLLLAQNYFITILPLLSSYTKTTTNPQSSNNMYIGHKPLTEKLLQLQKENKLSHAADAPAIALLIMGAAMHSALSTITQGSNALHADNTLWAERITTTLLQGLE